jgi:mono/diheme cytochrome c family protein
MITLFSGIFITCFGSALVLDRTSFQDDELSKSKARGKDMYEEHCITCHQEDGTGIPGVFPPVAQSDYLYNNQVASIKAMKFGQEGEITVNGTSYNTAMPAAGLSDAEIADVLNYIQNSWGNKGEMILPQDIEKVIKKVE